MKEVLHPLSVLMAFMVHPPALTVLTLIHIIHPDLSFVTISPKTIVTPCLRLLWLIDISAAVPEHEALLQARM